jgi:hypothetical protein
LDTRRITLVLVFCFIAPMGVVILTTAMGNPQATDWAITLGMICGIIALVAAILIGSARMGRRALAATKASLHGSLFVYRAMDEQVVPRGVRLLTADRSGLALSGGRGAKLRQKWFIPWSDVESAEVTTARFHTGAKPALVIHLRAGDQRTLGLVGAYGISNPLRFAQDAAQIINGHRSGTAAR